MLPALANAFKYRKEIPNHPRSYLVGQRQSEQIQSVSIPLRYDLTKGLVIVHLPSLLGHGRHRHPIAAQRRHRLRRTTPQLRHKPRMMSMMRSRRIMTHLRGPRTAHHHHSTTARSRRPASGRYGPSRTHHHGSQSSHQGSLGFASLISLH